MIVIDWAARLRCQDCGERSADPSPQRVLQSGAGHWQKNPPYAGLCPSADAYSDTPLMTKSADGEGTGWLLAARLMGFQPSGYLWPP